MVSSRKSLRFCPNCGISEGPFIGMFCKNCYLKDHPELVKVPDKYELSSCNRCGKIRPYAKWVVWDDAIVTSWIEEKIKIRDLEDTTIGVKWVADPKKPKEYNVYIHVNGIVETSPLHYEAKSRLFVRGGICNDDMLVNSDYYESIIQVRFEDKSNDKMRQVQKDIEEALKPMHATDSKAVVVNWVAQKHGLDAWIVSKKAGKAAAIYVQRKYHGTVSVSSKLVGLDVHTSKTKNRPSFLVRIP